MRISLCDGNREAVLLFDPDQVKWVTPKTPNERHRIHAASLPAPFHRLFLKRFQGKAPAHTLLTRAVGSRLPAATPQIYGWGNEGSDYIYAFHCLPPDYQKLSDLLKDGSGIQYLTPDFMRRVAKQAENLFAAIGRTPFAHFFTDFCTKNIMYNPKTGALVYIDLDSAWPFAVLHQQENGPLGHKFDIFFWRLWLKYSPEARRNHQHHHLPKTMVLSFAAAFGRALGLLRHPEDPAARLLCLKPATFEQINQDPLWKALKERDEATFRAFFLLPSRPDGQDDLFDTWSAVFEELTQSLTYVPRTRVREAVEALAAAQDEASRSATASLMPRLSDILNETSLSGVLAALQTGSRKLYEAARTHSTQFSATRFWQEMTSIWRSRDRGYQRLNLVFLIHLLAGCGVTVFSAVTHIDLLLLLLSGGIALAFRRVRAFAREQLWDTASEQWVSALGFGAPFVLPAAGTFFVLLLDLVLIYVLILYHAPKNPLRR